MWAERIAKVEHGGLAAIADTVMERYFAADFRAAHPERVAAFRRTLLQTDPRGYVACSHAIAAVDWLDRLDRIACPTLVIAGAQDVGAPVSMSQAMAERIPGAELAVVADAAHLTVIEQPAVFASLVERFLERIERVA